MPERCAECGSYLYPFEDKICRACYEDLKRENDELREIVKRSHSRIQNLEAEIIELYRELEKLQMYKEVVMEDPKLWSKLVAKRLTVHPI